MTADVYDEIAFASESSQRQDRTEVLNAALESAKAMAEEIEQMEEDLKALKASYRALTEGVVVDLLDELGMSKLTFKGWDVSVSDFCRGSLPKDPQKRAEAIKWLDLQGAGGLVRTQVSVKFGKDEREEATLIVSRLKAAGLEPAVEEGVHSSTLAAFGRERMRNGEPLDPELLGLAVGRVAKFKKSTSPLIDEGDA